MDVCATNRYTIIYAHVHTIINFVPHSICRISAKKSMCPDKISFFPIKQNNIFVQVEKSSYVNDLLRLFEYYALKISYLCST